MQDCSRLLGLTTTKAFSSCSSTRNPYSCCFRRFIVELFRIDPVVVVFFSCRSTRPPLLLLLLAQPVALLPIVVVVFFFPTPRKWDGGHDCCSGSPSIVHVSIQSLPVSLDEPTGDPINLRFANSKYSLLFSGAVSVVSKVWMGPRVESGHLVYDIRWHSNRRVDWWCQTSQTAWNLFPPTAKNGP